MAYDPCSGGVTPEHFTLWERQARAMDDRSLRYAVVLCRQTEWRLGNSVESEFYAAQARTFGMELTRRRRSR